MVVVMVMRRRRRRHPLVHTLKPLVRAPGAPGRPLVTTALAPDASVAALLPRCGRGALLAEQRADEGIHSGSQEAFET